MDATPSKLFLTVVFPHKNTFQRSTDLGIECFLNGKREGEGLRKKNGAIEFSEQN